MNTRSLVRKTLSKIKKQSQSLLNPERTISKHTKFIMNFSSKVAIDKAHAMFLLGTVLSQKPETIVELGMGSGYVTRTLLAGIAYNQKGQLTCVDSWHDWSGEPPKHLTKFAFQGVQLVNSTEKEFTVNCDSEKYDLLISDADHHHAQEWIDETIRIVRINGMMFFHDTNQPDKFPGLTQIERRVRELGYPYYHFTENSRADERCDRGWLFVIKRANES